MKQMIAIHQCHYDDKDNRRQVAAPGDAFAVKDAVADVLVKAGAARIVEVVAEAPRAEDAPKAKSRGRAKVKAEPADADGDDLV